MYPQAILTLYDIFILVGVVAAFLSADRMAQKRGFSLALQRVVILSALAAVVVGYGSAVLFQAFYNFMETGKFEIAEDTGATFYGGFIGGAVAFLVVYFLLGRHWCKDREECRRFPDMADIAACCVPLAHAFGRLGCLTAGCCHGAETDAWYGIRMWVEVDPVNHLYDWRTVVPVQLFESIFLFILAGALFFLFYKNTGRHKFPLLPVYCVGYGIWRFLIEFARTDDRGATVVSALSPSQLIALVLIVVGAVYFAVWFFRFRKPAAVRADSEQAIAAPAESEPPENPSPSHSPAEEPGGRGESGAEGNPDKK